MSGTNARTAASAMSRPQNLNGCCLAAPPRLLLPALVARAIRLVLVLVLLLLLVLVLLLVRVLVLVLVLSSLLSPALVPRLLRSLTPLSRSPSLLSLSPSPSLLLLLLLQELRKRSPEQSGTYLQQRVYHCII
jgi:hypothetical protein